MAFETGKTTEYLFFTSQSREVERVTHDYMQDRIQEYGWWPETHNSGSILSLILIVPSCDLNVYCKL